MKEWKLEKCRSEMRNTHWERRRGDKQERKSKKRMRKREPSGRRDRDKRREG